MDIFVTVVVQDLGSKGYGIYVPDMNLVKYGNDQIVAIGEVIQMLRAIRYYKVKNGLEFEANITAEEAQKYCKSSNDFVTVVAVSLVA